jgi:hypothetical protein
MMEFPQHHDGRGRMNERVQRNTACRNASKRFSRHARAVLVLLALGVAHLAQAGEVRDSDADARAIMKKSAEYLSSLEHFRFEAELVGDTFTDAAEMIEIGGSRIFSVKRPSQLRVESQGRDATTRMFVANATKVLLTLSPQNIHYETDSPGSLDDLVDMFTAQLGVRPPLAQLVYSNLWRVLAIRIESGRYIGEAEIGGTKCDHLAFRNFDADWQVWVERGDRPVIRRLAIRYKSRLGHPTVRAEFKNWQIDADLPDSLFEIEIPKGSRKVELSDIQG